MSISKRAWFFMLALVLALVPWWMGNEYELRLFMLFMTYAIIALGLHVLVGLTGLLSLGQAGLFALGAYVAAILATRVTADILVCSVVAVALGGAVGALLAYPAVRVRGVYLAVVTIAFGLIVENIAVEWSSLTGGTTGISAIPSPALLGMPLDGQGLYVVLAACLFGVALAAFHLKHSRFGRAMLAVSQSETASRGVGINPTAIRTLAFMVAASCASLAGVFYSFLNSYISPDIFTFSESVRFLLMVILGGAATVAGALAGSLVLTYLPEVLQQFQYWQQFAYGALLFLVMLCLPKGMVGTMQVWLGFFSTKRQGSGQSVSANAPILALKETTGQAFCAKSLTVRFGGLTALERASLMLQPGKVHALIGPNGAGKSTFINTITGFYRPQEGDFSMGGESLLGVPPHRIARAGLARTFQNTELFGQMTVLENVMVGFQSRMHYSLISAMVRTAVFGREERQCRDESMQILDWLGLAGYAQTEAASLPFGLQRKLEVARALASRPEVLLMDEPAAGLTAAELKEMEALIRQVASMGISVLLIEHHIDLIMAVADRITVLDYGKVIAEDSPSAIRTNDRVIQAYLGSTQLRPAGKGA